MITSFPVAFEIYDEKELIAKISMFDEGASSVEIMAVNNPSSWQEVSRAIFFALKAMHPEDKA